MVRQQCPGPVLLLQHSVTIALQLIEASSVFARIQALVHFLFLMALRSPTPGNGNT